MREPTIAGLAAGLYAAGRIPADRGARRNKLLDIAISDARGSVRSDIALVDAVISHDHYIGARALWKTDTLAAVYVSFADPQAIGLSAIGGPAGAGRPARIRAASPCELAATRATARSHCARRSRRA